MFGPFVIVGALYMCSAVIGGCGGSGSSSSSARPAAASSQAPSTTTSTSSSALASTTTATSTASAPTTSTSVSTTSGTGAGGASLAGPGECRASGLALSYLGGQGATGHGELGFALRNTTQSSCRTGGYPGIQFLDRSGGALPTTPTTHTTSDFFGTLPLAPLTVAPGASFSFRLGVSHGGGSGAGCTTAYGLQVIPPNDTATLRVDIPGGASECGATTVSPVQPGTSAFH